VNRDNERERLLSILEDYRNTAIEANEPSAREARILVSGERGVGKSILTRRVLAEFEQKHPHQVITVTIDSRSLPYRAVLSELARALTSKVQPEAQDHRRELLPLLDYVQLLATYNQIQRTQLDTIQTKYQAQAGLGAEAIVKLTGSLSWEQTRAVGTGTQATVTVTDNLLHSAIDALLGELAKSPWLVVIFYDDLDQALAGTAGDEILSVFRRVLDLRPCIALVHVRTECCVENLAREMTENVEIAGLKKNALVELLRRRLQRAPSEVRAYLGQEENWRVLNHLASLTDNALVYLRWVNGLLRTHDATPASGWATDEALQAIVVTAAPVQGFDRRVLSRVVAAVDAQPTRWFTREALLRMGHDSQNGEPGFSAQDIEDLEKLGLLVPRYRFRQQGELYLEPVFDLLRPSLRTMLRD
jgi:GTPase SAR1 family protein